MDIKREEFEKLVLESKSKSELCLKLGFSNNGANFKKIDEMIIKYGLSLEIFKKVKHEKKIKNCPICGNCFEFLEGHKKEKKTCSRSCANSFFRSGKDNPNYKDISEYDIRDLNFSRKYREICFKYHEHKCVVCDEKLMLDVHHFDGDKTNNKADNLIPLCATHHNYWHSRYKYLIENKVVEYKNNFK